MLRGIMISNSVAGNNKSGSMLRSLQPKIKSLFIKKISGLNNKKELKKLINSSAAFGFPAVINLLSLLVFTRILSLENYGLLSLTLISVELLQGVAFNWVKMSMMRFYKEDDKTSSLTIGLAFNLAITLVLLTVISFVLIFSERFGAQNANLISLVGILSIGRGFCNYLQDYIRISNSNLNKYTVITVLSNASYYLPAIVYVLVNKTQNIYEILLFQAGGIFTFLFIFLIGYLTTLEITSNRVKQFFSVIIFDWKNQFRKYFEDNKSIYIGFLKYGLPLIIVAVSASMFVRIDRFIIEHNVGLRELGAYSAAFSLSNLLISSFFTVLTLPTYPEILKKLNQGETAQAKLIHNRNGSIILAVAVPLVLFSAIFNTFLCQIIFGEKGSEISLLFPIVVLGTFLYNYKVHYFDQIFQFCHKTNIYMLLGILIGCGHFILAYKLSALWGAKGVAYSGIILNLLSIVFIYFYSLKHFKITFNKRLCLALFSLLIISSGVWEIKNYLF